MAEEARDEKARLDLLSEQQSHDAEINRIADELGIEDGATIESIVDAIRKLKANQKQKCGDCGEMLPHEHGWCPAREDGGYG